MSGILVLLLACVASTYGNFAILWSATSPLVEQNEFTCKYTKHGAEYRGKTALTISGHECQRWDSQTPHAHDFAWPRLFAEDAVSDAANFCRNPDHYNRQNGPWCLTTNPEVEWEYCAVPFCNDDKECKSTVRGQAYSGYQSISKEGNLCQRWDAQYPESHKHTNMVNFPDATLFDAHNFCRNPNNKALGPWCITLAEEQKWEYCDVSVCDGPQVIDAGSDEICKSTSMGTTYRGKVNVTKNGLACQRWDSQSPHSHTRNNALMFPEETLAEAENYCRNPDDEPFGPWCYTTDPETRWNYCNVDDCTDLICKETFDKLEHMHAEGGHPYPEYDHSVEECLAQCLAEPQCNAVDFHHGDNVWQETRCWFHTVYNMKEEPANQVDLYKRNGCGAPNYACGDSFEVIENWHAEEGVGIDATNRVDCRAACRADDNCIAFDYDRSNNPWQGKRCWLHLDEIVVVPETNTDHYPRNRC